MPRFVYASAIVPWWCVYWLQLAIIATAAATDTCKGNVPVVSADAEVQALYKAALREAAAAGGPPGAAGLVVYEGGDGRNQQADSQADFNAQFPGINARFIVDLSKYHDVNIDNQLQAARGKDPGQPGGKIAVDVAHLQTINDFYRWRDQGELAAYKPPGWNQVYDDVKDRSGYFTATRFNIFANLASASLTKQGVRVPVEDADYMEPRWRGHMVLTYPNDDDAVLYQFYKLYQNHGWAWVERLATQQQPRWVRGTETPLAMLGNGTAPDSVSFTGAGPMIPLPSNNNNTVTFGLPVHSWFLSWGQTAAVFKRAPHPSAARLYMAWSLTTKTQNASFVMAPTRRDVPPKPGYKPIPDYPNTSPADFIQFMLNRTLVDSFRQRITSLIGPVRGASPLEDPTL